MKWDDYRYNEDPAKPVFWIKKLLRFRGFKVDLHKMVSADGLDRFHSHPYRAFRLVLWGGYIEQLEGNKIVEWRPGMFGMVYPDTVHRIHALLNGRVSYSLWIAGPSTHRVRLVGSGWGPEEGKEV